MKRECGTLYCCTVCACAVLQRSVFAACIAPSEWVGGWAGRWVCGWEEAARRARFVRLRLTTGSRIRSVSGADFFRMTHMTASHVQAKNRLFRLVICWHIWVNEILGFWLGRGTGASRDGRAPAAVSDEGKQEPLFEFLDMLRLV